MTTLARIRLKVRRITTSMSPTDLSDTEIDDAINTFYCIDMPERLRLLDLRRTYSFQTQPYVDTYDFPSDEYVMPLEPFLAAGYPIQSYREPNSFALSYQNLQYKTVLAQSDGSAVYTGTISGTPFLQRHVLISGTTANGTVLCLTDTPANNLEGILSGDGAGTVNYVTGEIKVEFNDTLDLHTNVYAQTVNYAPSRPSAILYYNNQFVIRPVPNDAYTISMSAYVKPTALLNATDKPDQAFMWQYLAQGAAMKIFEDRQNFQGIERNQPLLQYYENIVESRTWAEAGQQRAMTIYDGPFGFNQGNFLPNLF